MSENIVKSLRFWAGSNAYHDTAAPEEVQLVRDAADEIERLRSENAALKTNANADDDIFDLLVPRRRRAATAKATGGEG